MLVGDLGLILVVSVPLLLLLWDDAGYGWAARGGLHDGRRGRDRHHRHRHGGGWDILNGGSRRGRRRAGFAGRDERRRNLRRARRGHRAEHAPIVQSSRIQQPPRPLRLGILLLVGAEEVDLIVVLRLGLSGRGGLTAEESLTSLAGAGEGVELSRVGLDVVVPAGDVGVRGRVGGSGDGLEDGNISLRGRVPGERRLSASRTSHCG